MSCQWMSSDRGLEERDEERTLELRYLAKRKRKSCGGKEEGGKRGEKRVGGKGVLIFP